MPPRDRSGHPDPDDWFAERNDAPPASGARARLPRKRERQQFTGSDERYRRDFQLAEPAADPGLTLTLGTLLAIAAVGLAAIVMLVLVLSGVFSGGSKHSATTTKATTTPATTATPSTALARRQTHPLRAAIPIPTVTLRPGEQGAQVKRLQQALERLGYLNKPADGIYGDSTQNALAALQRVSLLPADGIFGPRTLGALDQAVEQADRGRP